jgi:hypothetical protein
MPVAIAAWLSPAAAADASHMPRLTSSAPSFVKITGEILIRQKITFSDYAAIHAELLISLKAQMAGSSLINTP